MPSETLFRHRCAALLVCLVAVLACRSALTNNEAGTPRLHLPEPRWSFGEVKEGERPERTFVIENSGAEVLSIYRVLESCGGCFKLELAKKELWPGEKTTLKVTVLTARRPGEFRKYVYIESNDPELSRRRIVITGTIKPRSDSGPGSETTEPEAARAVDVSEASQATGEHPVRITYFTSLTCEECRATHKALVKLREAHESVAVREFDIDELEEYAVLLRMEKAHGRIKHAPPIIYVGTMLLDGWEEVRAKFGPTVGARLEDGAAAEWPVEVAGTGNPRASAFELVLEKFRTIGPFAVIAAGLVDGINPCALATIVFLVSLLGRFGKSHREIAVVGVCFTLAVFVTYLLLGLGLAKAIQVFSVSTGIAKVITYSIAALVLLMAGYSLYDYFAWRRNRSGAGMKLKLPRAVQRRIHSVMKAGLSSRSLVIAALVTGVCISVLESICTGQVYLPSIIFVLRDPSLRLHALAYLVLYNVMFILPLVVIFLLAYFGLQSATLARLAQRHTGTTKLLLAAVFLGLGVLLLATT